MGSRIKPFGFFRDDARIKSGIRVLYMDKNIIRDNFSRNAGVYDDHASVQKQSARRLIALLKDKTFSNILEIGCGTGFYTKALRESNPAAKIEAIDISEEMVKVAHGKIKDTSVQFIVIDGERIALNKKFDLITSNAAFQWFLDLDRSFSRFKKHLTKGGILCFSMYGPETFRELGEVFSHRFGKHLTLTSKRFLTFKTVGDIMRKHFEEVEMKEEFFTADFVSLLDFLKDIKFSGTRGEGLAKNIFLGKYTLKAAEKAYIDKFRGIRATHHLYFCVAKNE